MELGLRQATVACALVTTVGCSDPEGRGDESTISESASIGTLTASSGQPTSGTTAGSSGGTTAPTATADPDDSGSGFVFDVGVLPDGGGGGCGSGGAGDLSFSYIWIANSGQGTLSKIDTQTMVEEGRYQVSPTGTGLPSRTSVNLSGDVAVANRTGGITKVYAEIEDCQESNGTPGIQTSSGAADILPWGQEECIAWYSDFTYGSQRPIAWTQGTYNEANCTWEDQKVWTTGTTLGGSADVILLNGDDGTVDGMINVPGLNVSNSYGGYGAVVDSDGNLWFNEMYIFGDALIRVSADDLSYEVIPTQGRSGYGLAIDEVGRIWTCGSFAVNRYDPMSSTWMSAANGLDLGGCMVDGEGRLWVSGSNGAPFTFRAFDTETVSLVEEFSIPEHVHGVSIDFEGNIWGVGGVPGVGQGTTAYRMDPNTGDFQSVGGLVDAYTYSDMTGFALVGATAPPG